MLFGMRTLALSFWFALFGLFDDNLGLGRKNWCVIEDLKIQKKLALKANEESNFSFEAKSFHAQNISSKEPIPAK